MLLSTSISIFRVLHVYFHISSSDNILHYYKKSLIIIARNDRMAIDYSVNINNIKEM